jgi:hypothetical protein
MSPATRPVSCAVNWARGSGKRAMAVSRLREPWYVAYKSFGGTSMRVFKSKRLALKAAAVILRDRAADVQVGPMVDTREGVLRGEQLRRVVERL